MIQAVCKVIQAGKRRPHGEQVERSNGTSSSSTTVPGNNNLTTNGSNGVGEKRRHRCEENGSSNVARMLSRGGGDEPVVKRRKLTNVEHQQPPPPTQMESDDEEEELDVVGCSRNQTEIENGVRGLVEMDSTNHQQGNNNREAYQMLPNTAAVVVPQFLNPQPHQYATAAMNLSSSVQPQLSSADAAVSRQLLSGQLQPSDLTSAQRGAVNLTTQPLNLSTSHNHTTSMNFLTPNMNFTPSFLNIPQNQNFYPQMPNFTQMPSGYTPRLMPLLNPYTTQSRFASQFYTFGAVNAQNFMPTNGHTNNNYRFITQVPNTPSSMFASQQVSTARQPPPRPPPNQNESFPAAAQYLAPQSSSAASSGGHQLGQHNQTAPKNPEDRRYDGH